MIVEPTGGTVDSEIVTTIQFEKETHDAYFYGYGDSSVVDTKEKRHSNVIRHIYKNLDEIISRVDDCSVGETTLTSIELDRDGYKKFSDIKERIESEFPDRNHDIVFSAMVSEVLEGSI
jgi:uncharacterized protein with LGFP repeats